MKLTLKTNSFRKNILLYRKLRYRKGHGVHSPFVYNLISKVINERGRFYCQDEIESTREKVLSFKQIIRLRKKENPEEFRNVTVGKVVKKAAISPRAGALLLRLTNYFKPKTILQIGGTTDISMLYLSSYATGLKCVVVEKSPEMASAARLVLETHNHTGIDLRTGDYKEVLPNVLAELPQPDFVFLNPVKDMKENEYAFNQCLRRLHNESVLVVRGIKASRDMRMFWKAVREREEVTVTIDLYSMGIIFFNKKLYKRNYIVSF